VIARVFPRRTAATPTDDLAFIGEPDLFAPKGLAEVHVSVTFTWDLPEAERIAKVWERHAPVKIGGPATGMRGEDFEPGRYVAPGYTITSRGCPNKCWFCSVWRRDGGIRELPVRDGDNILDDNLLACSDEHVRKVFAMLRRQKKAARFTGGLEAAKLRPWHVSELASMRIKEMFFAFDTDDDWEPLRGAAKMLREAGFPYHKLRAYVLIGHPKDTMELAEKRLRDVWSLGIIPMAMLWRGTDGGRDRAWAKFARAWARPSLVCGKIKAETGRPAGASGPTPT